MIKVYSLNQIPQAVTEFLSSVQKRNKRNYDTMMKRMVQIVRTDIADHFDKAEGPTGKWDMLKNPRPGSKGADKPLQDTGLLRRAATTDAPGNITRIVNGTIEVGVSLVQARIQSEGGTI